MSYTTVRVGTGMVGSESCKGYIVTRHPPLMIPLNIARSLSSLYRDMTERKDWTETENTFEWTHRGTKYIYTVKVSVEVMCLDLRNPLCTPVLKPCRRRARFDLTVDVKEPRCEYRMFDLRGVTGIEVAVTPSDDTAGCPNCGRPVKAVPVGNMIVSCRDREGFDASVVLTVTEEQRCSRPTAPS